MNDSPQISAPLSFIATEDEDSALSGISISDPDIGANAINIQLSVDRGSVAWADEPAVRNQGCRLFGVLRRIAQRTAATGVVAADFPIVMIKVQAAAGLAGCGGVAGCIDIRCENSTGTGAICGKGKGKRQGCA